MPETPSLGAGRTGDPVTTDERLPSLTTGIDLITTSAIGN